MQRRKKLRGLQRRNAISGYLFILPFIIGFLAFMVKPLFQSLYMSFCNVEIGAGSFDMILAGIQIMSGHLPLIRSLPDYWQKRLAE